MLKLIKESTEIKPISTKEQDNEIVDNAFANSINNLTQSIWSLIADLNATFTTFDLDYSGDNKDEIKAILSGITDDLTINIGMLNKINILLDSKTDDLIEQGKEKAEEIVNLDKD